MNELSRRFRLLRISLDITQNDLSQMTGVSLATIKRFENGSDIKVSTLSKLLSQLGMNNVIEGLIPDMSDRPSYRARLEEDKVRKRVRKTKKVQKWEWGE